MVKCYSQRIQIWSLLIKHVILSLKFEIKGQENYVMVGLIYELGTFYIVFLMYLLFFGVSMEISRKRFLVITGYAVTIILLGLGLGFSVVDVPVIMLITSLVFSKRKFRDSIMILPAILFYTILSVLSSIIINEIFGPKDLVEILGSILTLAGVIVDASILAGLIFLYFYVRKKQINLKLRGREILGLSGFFVLGFFIWFYVILVNLTCTEDWRIPCGVAGFVVYCAVFAVYVRHLLVVRNSAKFNQQVKDEKEYVDMLLTYLEKYKEENENIRELRHDLRNHVQVMQKLYEKKDSRELEKYMANLSGKTERIKEIHITGNQAADIVISGQKERAESLDIAFSCKGEFAALNRMQAVDVCTIFSNLLDNAYEASVEVKDPFISIQGVKNRNYFVVEVSNRTKNHVKITDGVALTGKKEKGHGNGMGIVTRTVKKYGGECVFQCKDNIFSCKMMFPLDKEDLTEKKETYK